MNYQTGRVTYAAGVGGSTKFYLSTNKILLKYLLSKPYWYPLHTLTFLTGQNLNKEVLKLDMLSGLFFSQGNKDQNPVELVLKGEVKGLKAAYSVVGGAGKITLTGAVGKGGIEYRIGKAKRERISKYFDFPSDAI